MRKILPLITLLAACAKPAPVAPPAATAALLTTVGDSTTIIESVALHEGKLYTTSWQGDIYEIDPAAPAPKIVGKLPIPCGYLGEVMDSVGNLLVACADSGTVYRVAHERLGAADFNPKKDAKVFITGAGHANGLTIAADGHVWITGGDIDTLYHTGPAGGKAVAFAGGYSPVSGDTTIPVRGYVVNGVTIDSRGNAYTVNTGTGAVYRLEVKADHTPGTITKVAESPELIGADGIIAGPGDTLYMNANFRNTFAQISPTGAVRALVVSSGSDTTVRRMGPEGQDLGPSGVLRFPAELVRDGKTVYIANLNFPVGANAAGHRAGATIARVTLP